MNKDSPAFPPLQGAFQKNPDRTLKGTLNPKLQTLNLKASLTLIPYRNLLRGDPIIEPHSTLYRTLKGTLGWCSDHNMWGVFVTTNAISGGSLLLWPQVNPFWIPEKNPYRSLNRTPTLNPKPQNPTLFFLFTDGSETIEARIVTLIDPY